MRRVLVVLLIALFALVVAPGATTQQPEPVELVCPATGADYGTGHVAAAAQAGLFPEDHVPGQHVGFSTCVP
jgi:hypothetical protein